MPIPMNCACGASYTLKDEFAGQRLRCPKCGTELIVGQPVAGAAAAGPALDPAFDRDKFLLRQQHFAISEKYYVHDEQGNPIIFVQRPAYLLRNLLALAAGVVTLFGGIFVVAVLASLLGEGPASGFVMVIGILAVFVGMFAVIIFVAPKRHVAFYRDDSKTEQLLEVLQDSKWQIPTATYTLRDPSGRTLALYRKNFLFDIFRKRWTVHDPSGREMAMAKEDSILLSMLRRFLGPLFGALRTNFIIVRGEGEQVIGEFNRKFTLLDRYVLDLSADPRRTLDRRVALALGVLLDTGERR